MRTSIAVGLALLTALPLTAQINANDQAVATPEHPWEMVVPPPVSGAAYASLGGAEEASNFLRTGVTLSGGYIRNLNPGSGTQTINDGIYLVQPSFALDRTTTRSHATLTYEPAFTWYAPTSLNTTDHAVSGDINMRLSPHVSLRTGETFSKTSSAFGQVTPTFQTPVTGSTAFVTPGVVGLFVPEITNETMAGMSWQFDRNSMIAASGWLNLLHMTNGSQAKGLYDSDTRGGSGSLIQRIGPQQYLGGLYQYATTQANPVIAAQTGKSEFQSNNLFGFYTAYPRPNVSLSLQGGGQYYILTSNAYPQYRKWTPAGTASIGLQGDHASLAMSYSRLATAGQGVVGGFMTNAALASTTWELARRWRLALEGGYSTIGNLSTVTSPQAIQNGHTVSGSAGIEHGLSADLTVSCNYARLHQSYGAVNIPAVTNNPDSDRVLISLTYRLSRPIGQ